MARTKSPTLTDAELRLMNVVWEKGSATVADVVDALPKSLGLAYSTVLTTMRILEEKGYLRHSKDGRAFVYHPVVDRKQASRNALRHIVSSFFAGSPELLVLNLLEEENISAKELARLKKLIAASE